MGIAHNQKYTVAVNGTSVKLTFGNVPITIDYNTALDLARYLRVAGKKAKANAGDKSRTIVAYGLLTDAEKDLLAEQNLRQV